jgi:proteasome lid subunit RPN8/RPN11
MEGMQGIQLSREHWESMRSHVEACLPNEACGILGGIGEEVHEVIPVTNELQSPHRFRMDPVEQLAAMQRIESLRLEMIGIFHSHVYGPEDPSQTDLDEAYYPRVAYLVWSPEETGWKCRSFRLLDGVAFEIPLSLMS